MRCAICIRQERGFGWFNPGMPLFSPQHQKSHRKFCSMRCQDIYATQRRRHAMIDPTPLERAALQACLKPMGELMAEIGFDVPPARYSREHALQLIEVIVTAFQERIVAASADAPEVPF